MVHLWLVEVMVKVMSSGPAAVGTGRGVRMKAPVKILIVSIGQAKPRTKCKSIYQGINDER